MDSPATNTNRTFRRDHGIRRVLVSCLLVFHLVCIVVAPQRASLLGQQLGSFIDPYTRTFALEVVWSFFAPEPNSPRTYIQWEKLSRAGESLGTGIFPEVEDPFWLRERQNRRVTLARFMSQSDEHAGTVMPSYLCRSDPQVYSVRVWIVLRGNPRIGEVFRGDRRIGDDGSSQRRLAMHTFCQGRT